MMDKIVIMRAEEEVAKLTEAQRIAVRRGIPVYPGFGEYRRAGHFTRNGGHGGSIAHTFLTKRPDLFHKRFSGGSFVYGLTVYGALVKFVIMQMEAA